MASVIELLARLERAEQNLQQRADSAELTDLFRDVRAALTKHASLLASLPSILMIWDPQHNPSLRYVSPTIKSILGYEPELGPNPAEIVHPEDLEKVKELFRGILSAPGATQLATFRLRHRDGTWRWMEVTIINRMDDPTIRGVIIHQHDVTELTEIRHALQDLQQEAMLSRLQLRQIVDLVPINVHVKDQAGRFLLVNQQVADFIGKPISEIEGQLLSDLVAPETAATSRAVDLQTLSSGEKQTVEIEIKTNDGRSQWFHRVTVPFLTLDGKLAVLTGAIDITELKRTERALRLAEHRYRTQFEHAPEAILVYDAAVDRFVDTNPSARELLGRDREDLAAITPSQLERPKGPSAVSMVQQFKATLDSGHPRSFETELRRAEGEPVPCEVRVSPLPDEREQLVRVSIVDISERKRLESLRERSFELEMQNRRFREASRLKSEFLANMSHELRTPLNAIIGFAQLLHTGYVAPDSPEHSEFVGDILASGRHLLQLINDVLDLSKIEAGKLTLHPERVDLKKLVGEVAAVMRGLIAERRISLELQLDPYLVDVVIDASRFKQILYNYLSNAFKFTPHGGRVVVRSRIEDAHRFRIEVEDSGIGIAPTDLPRLFQEFEQLDAQLPRTTGTGLGLALTRRLAEALGGQIGVRSIAGSGSIFHAILPRDAGPRIERLHVRTGGGKPLVLAVEDDERDNALLVETITAAGYEVVSATNGAQALEIGRERRFDAITLDLLLPDFSGLELLASLRAGGPNRDTPIIVVSVVASQQAIAGFHVHDVLHKPVDRKRLLDSLSQIGLASFRSGDILIVDDDPLALRLMEGQLAQLGRRAICCSDGKSGLEAAERLSPAAVVLDLLMPEMDGFEFLARLRQLPNHQQTPVLVWTSKDLSPSELSDLQLAAQGVIGKGLTTNDRLLQELSQLLDAAQARRAP